MLLAVSLSSILSLMLAEAAVRSLAPRRTYSVLTDNYPAMFDSSEVMPYRLRKNYSGRLANVDFDTTIHINSEGYRGAELAPADGQRRVLMIGDSFTFGWGVNDDQTYPFQVQRLFEGASKARVAVINAGFAAAYSPDTYYLYLKNEGLALNPDAIVVGIFVGNDLDSQFAFENEWLSTDPDGLPLSIRNKTSRVVDHYWVPWPIPFRYRTPVLSRSHLYQGLFDVWWNVAPRLRAWMPVGATLYAAAQADEAEDRVPYNYRLRFSERTDAVYARVRKLLLAMRDLAAARGIPIFFMVIPDSTQLSDGAYAGLPADVLKPQKEMAAFFEAHQMKHLDLLPALRRSANGSVLYYPNDRHFTVEGNRIAAKELQAFLAREWLVR